MVLRLGRKGFALCFALLMIVATGAAADTVCDDIYGMQEGWDEMAEAVDSMANEGFSEEDAMAADSAIAEAAEATYLFADQLSASGVASSARLGEELSQALRQLNDSQDIDSTLEALESIVYALSRIVEDCDNAMGEGTSPLAEDPGDELSAEIGPAAGAVVIQYTATAQPQLQPLVDLIQASGYFEAAAAVVDSVLILPTDLPVVFADCGVANAFFDPQNQRVVMCYEFFSLFASAFGSMQMPEAEAREAVLGTGLFFFLHEVGHALVHLLDLPITGREEDAVDNLATLILIEIEAEDALFATLDNFETWSSQHEVTSGQLAFWDEHSFNGQRLYDVACLMYGSAPESYPGMVGPDRLPAERAARCPGEYVQKKTSWDRLLEEHFAE